MSLNSLKAVIRSAKINKATEIPAELYGPGMENQHLVIVRNEFEKVYLLAGHSMLVDLQIGDQTVGAIIKEVQRGPLKNQVVHVDFMKPDPMASVTVKVDLEPEGKSNAIANMGGMLEKNLNNLKISCLPDKLVKSIKVDLGLLENLKSVIRVADITVPGGIVVKNNPRDVVFSIAASRKQRAAETKTEAPAKEKGKAKK